MYEDWLNPPPDLEPVCCPICEEECEEVYINRAGDVVGCDNCMSTLEAYEWAREQEENARAIMEDQKFDEWRDRQMDRD